MRLLAYYQETIKKYFIEFFENGELYLFGSREDDNKKGGDILFNIDRLDRKGSNTMGNKTLVYKQKVEDNLNEH